MKANSLHFDANVTLLPRRITMVDINFTETSWALTYMTTVIVLGWAFREYLKFKTIKEKSNT